VTGQSGRWKGKSFIGGGRPCGRAALFMGALAAARRNPALKAFRQRLIEAGKPELVAIIAVARKLLTISLGQALSTEQASARLRLKTSLPSAQFRVARQKAVAWRAAGQELAHAEA
jgi:transposase